MLKGIDLQAKVHVGADPAALSDLRQRLPDLFAAANPGLKLSVKKVSDAGSSGDATLRVYIEGEQDPAADFAALTRGALNKAIAAYNGGGGDAHAAGASASSAGSPPAPAAPPASRAAAPHRSQVHITDLKEMEGDEEDTDVTLAPQASARQPSQQPAPAPAPTPAQPPAPPPPAAAQAPTPRPQTPTARRPWWAFWRRDS